MMFLIFLIVPIMMTIVGASQDTCPVVRYTGTFDSHDHVKDHVLIGKSYKNLTLQSVQQCFSVCVQDCRCVSYQISKTRCELVDENRHTAPDRLKPWPGYQYFELKQRFKQKDVCSNQCNNECCRPQFQFCQNGGTCIELCQNVTRKFECKCRKGFSGRVCEIATSYSQLVPQTNFITLLDKSRMKVLCDRSEPGMVWTLIESFALSLKKKYRFKDFNNDFPVNTDNPNWTDYRLPRHAMQHIRGQSTHWRATCNFNTEGLVMKDYIRGRLNNMDIIKDLNGKRCAQVEYVNVRGINCSDCTVFIRQASQIHIFVDSRQGHKNRSTLCDIDLLNGAVTFNRIKYCDNFGYYEIINPAHRCSALPNSTTQWWLGTVIQDKRVTPRRMH